MYDLILPRCKSCGHSPIFARNLFLGFKIKVALQQLHHEWKAAPMNQWRVSPPTACRPDSVDSAELCHEYSYNKADCKAAL